MPVVPPKHATWVTLLTPETSALGWVRVTIFNWVQPLASVMVQVYVPAVNPLAVAPIPPEGLQAYVYGATPPVATAEAEPLGKPKPEGLVCAVVAESADAGSVNAVVCTAVQPFASVAVTE